MKKFAVIGNPIAHSKSPLIHSWFASQCGLELEYRAILAPEQGFAQTLQQLSQQGLSGANITLPFKEQAYALCGQLSERAQAAKAVNTVCFLEGQYYGENTDGEGLVLDLQSQLGKLTDSSILLLGAGGAAKGVILPLLQAGVASIHVANRTVSKARELEQQFATSLISHSGYHDIPEKGYSVVINATSASVQGNVPELPEHCFSHSSLAYDMFYGATETCFMSLAKQMGANQVSDGLGMLVGQAAAAFALWHGIQPNIAPVLAKLRAQLAETVS